MSLMFSRVLSVSWILISPLLTVANLITSLLDYATIINRIVTFVNHFFVDKITFGAYDNLSKQRR